MDAQIAKVTQKLTTADEVRENTRMLMQPYTNWEKFLAPAPLSIAIMGELVFISSCGDFSINKNPPVGGFKFIKHPESFRACLMQICNKSWHAFNEADKNMNEIRIHTGTIPDYIKSAVHVLFNGSDEVVQSLFPVQLQNIRTIAKTCLDLAVNTENKFSDVINLIHELLEASVKARRLYGEDLKEVQFKLEQTKLREQEALRMKEESKKAMEALSEQMDEAQKAYKEAMESLPSGWEMIAMDFVEGLTSSLTTVISGFTSLFSMFKKTPQSAAGQNYSGQTTDWISQIKVCSKSDVILGMAMSLKAYVDQNKINWDTLYDQENECVKTAMALSQFKRVSGELEQMPHDELCEKALSLCKEGINICVKLNKYTPGTKLDMKRTQELIAGIVQLNDEALVFDSMCKSLSGTPALTPKPPMAYKMETNSGNMSASQRASDNARFRIEQNREQLERARKAHEKSMESMEKNQEELTEILIEMQRCKLEEVDFKTTIEMLKKGLSAMGRVKEQWENMVHFFQMVSGIVRTSLSGPMLEFADQSKSVQTLPYDKRLFTKDILYKQAFQASNIANLVHMIAGTYTQVSNNFLMDRVSSLGRLMAMDKDEPEFEEERKKLQRSCEAAQKGILALAYANKKQFEDNTNARMLKIDNQLKALLPATSPQETMKIKELVKSGFEDEEDYV
ncbi:uncharacterized protein LOC115046477 [Echeneis naucrates]|uniref:Uncharacterized LOC115046477 n=1 Tax=Echeneis naucrates TaxID=173247 RepID=A0A665VMD7_ECHNA|nr:uncharacterized protein LOC115046477 [Echeneis naucrates]